MKLAGMVKTSTIDYPGHLAAVLFVPGCNYDCFYCHNRHLLGEVPLLDMEEAMRYLLRRKELLDGVVISGGEPTLQPDLMEMMKRIRQMGYSIKLDTNGSSPQVLEHILLAGLVQDVALDYKCPWQRYPEICGGKANATPVQESLDMLLDAEIRLEVRTTVIPQLSPQELVEMAHAIPPVPSYMLQIYRPPSLYRPGDRFRIQAVPYTPKQLLDIADEIRPRQPHVLVRA